MPILRPVAAIRRLSEGLGEGVHIGRQHARTNAAHALSDSRLSLSLSLSLCVYACAGPGQRLAPWLLPRDMGGRMHVRIRGSAGRGRHPIRRQ